MQFETQPAQYWSNRYRQSNTPWDIGTASPPLTAYFQGKVHREHRILIPGAGRAHDALWLWRNGFYNTHVLEIAPEPLELLLQQEPHFPKGNLHCEDFFEHTGTYDLIVEQTFFCALPPHRRPDYVRKMHELLTPGGFLMGVLFDFPLNEGPPFGGSRAEYRALLERYFNILHLERCYNSIAPRAGKELFLEGAKSEHRVSPRARQAQGTGHRAKET